MPNPTELREIIERLEKLGSEVDETRRGMSWSESVPGYTASLDAAVALVEKMLPGWNFTVASTKVPGDARPWADVASPAWIAGENDAEQGEGYGATPAIALLIALFRALEQKP